MLLQFQIEYKTYYGQQLMISGSLPRLGNGKREEAAAMFYQENSDGIWILQVETEILTGFHYRYFIRDVHDGTETEEWGPDRRFEPGSHPQGRILLKDHWRTKSDPGYALLTSAFTNVIFKQEKTDRKESRSRKKSGNSVVLRFKPDFSRIAPGHKLAVAGNSNALGSWDQNKAVILLSKCSPEWSCEVMIPVSEFPVKYKYLILNEKNEILLWERGNDRTLTFPEGFLPEVFEVRNEKPDFPVQPWKGAGVAIPVFSLRRKEGSGVGEFTDLKLLADWACETGLQMIQLLPVNDTVARHTWQDSYPYAAISVFALHPVYVNLFEIGRLHSATTHHIIEEQGRHLNKLAKIDYEAVMTLKSRYFKLIYDQEKTEFLSDPGFLAFFENNSHWLKPYAAFSYLRDLFNTPDFSSWKEFSKFSVALLDKVTDPSSPHYDDIAIHYFIQYHAHRQLLNASDYARSKGVVLKGDLPIGIYRNSVDAWVSPELYNMESQAGAPPDDFSVVGQNWRFPTYNWDVMARDNFAWWQQRLRHLSLYFDAFRIDHILGFFRIWEIPESQVQGLLGYFNPSIPYTRADIISRGIYFDEERFCRPYIRDYFLEDLFGAESAFVKEKFLIEYAPDCFRLHPGYDTQQKVEKGLVPAEDADINEKNRLDKIREGLFSLIAEVLFIEKQGPEGKIYFPRNSFHSTHSFRDLDEHTRQRLDEIYIDYFYSRNENFWRDTAMKRLPAVKSATNMLLCGEDLGMVPACVPSVMNELGILSLEVQRMPKDPKIEFGHPAFYPYLSVATPSSHDTSTIRGWWEENHQNIQKFYNQSLGNDGNSPASCSPDIVRQIIVQHLYAPSMWTVFPIQDLLGLDDRLMLPDPHAERINEPGNPNHYWRYRMHLDLEELPLQKQFNQQLKQLIEESGRNRVY